MKDLGCADFVIIGTGAGGATAARALVEAGFEVLLLESGRKLQPSERPRELVGAMAAAMRDFGAQTTTGVNPMILLQGHCVGGSTAVNSGIIWRLPDDVREDWEREYGLGDLVAPHLMSRIASQIEGLLGVAPTPEMVSGGNAHTLRLGSDALGLQGRPTDRNAPGCKGSSQCLQGCPEGARQSMDTSFIPWVEQRGARLICEAAAERVELGPAGRRTVIGKLGQGSVRQDFKVEARHGVIVAAGALHTPLILLASGVRGRTGHGFQAHPGMAVVGKFDEPIQMGFGATQAYEVPLRQRGFKIESLSLPPEMLASRIPGSGQAWQSRLACLDHYAQWCAQVRMLGRGRVTRGWGGRPRVKFRPLPEDLAKVHESVCLMAQMMFRAGATEVYTGLDNAPPILHTESDAVSLAHQPFSPSDFHLVASHLFGTAAAGIDPDRSVVAPNLEVHGLPGVYVMDASVFPTNLGVNPQHAIMCVAWSAAERAAEAALSRRAKRAL